MKYEYDNFEKLDSIEVTLAMGCKLDCRFCPQGLLLKRYFAENRQRVSMMKFDSFKYVLEKVKKGGTICFSGLCEPFLNPECDDMIVYAYKNGYRVTLLTTLVGFRKESIEKIRNIVFDEVTLHIPDEEGNSKFDITEEYLENLKLFHENIKVSNYSCHGRIHPLVKDKIDRRKFVNSTMHNRSGNLECGMSCNPKGKIVCMVGTNENYGNWNPEVLPDGTLILCCMDYGMKHILGNLLDMSVSEILNSREYQIVQRGMQEDGSDILCRKCVGAKEIDQVPAYKFKVARQKERMDKKVGVGQEGILQLFSKSKNVCVFGLGKLFWNNFFHHKWNEVLGQTCYSDNSSELWGKEIEGIKCIPPYELKNMEELLVITHISDDKLVRQQLKEMGIENVINIREIYKMVF